MIKEIKKCYYRLNLPYTATEEEIVTNQKILIKVLRAKGIQRGISYKNKIEQVNKDTEMILAYVKENGNNSIKEHFFETTSKSVFIQLCVLIMVAALALTCFVTLF